GFKIRCEPLDEPRRVGRSRECETLHDHPARTALGPWKLEILVLPHIISVESCPGILVERQSRFAVRLVKWMMPVFHARLICVKDSIDFRSTVQLVQQIFGNWRGDASGLKVS